MMAFLLKTTQGPKEVSGHQIEKLRKDGKLQDNMRCISIDGAQTWVTYSEAVELIKQRRKDSPPKLDVASVPVRESTLTPELTTASLATRSGTKTTLPSKKGKRVLQIVVPCVVLLALSGWALLRTNNNGTTQVGTTQVGATEDGTTEGETVEPGIPFAFTNEDANSYRIHVGFDWTTVKDPRLVLVETHKARIPNDAREVILQKALLYASAAGV